MTKAQTFEIPRIPASAGALLFDPRGRLLILKPVYKEGWSIPGGMVESDGESPWDGCRREVLEETGLVVSRGRLVAVDFRRPRTGKPGGMRFLFDCGHFDDGFFAGISLQAAEVCAYRLVDRDSGLDLLTRPLSRRVGAALGAGGDHAPCLYLEDGRPVDGVGIAGDP